MCGVIGMSDSVHFFFFSFFNKSNSILNLTEHFPQYGKFSSQQEVYNLSFQWKNLNLYTCLKCVILKKHTYNNFSAFLT